MAVADFNGDGKLDLAMASVTEDDVLVLLGNGDGTFTAAPHVLPNIQSIALAVADLNGDGIADMVVETHIPQFSAYVLLGNGDGTFTTLPSDPNLSHESDAVAIGDFNGDGIPDLVQPNQSGGTTSVFFGKGDGTFVPDAFSPSLANFIFTSIAVADFNGDGRSDIAESSYSYYNSPSNLLTSQLDVLLAQSSSTVAAYVTNISPVGMGLHDVDASYPGDSNNLPGISNTIPLVAEPVTTALTLAASPTSSSAGQAVTLTATLSPFFAQNHSASGNVTFTSNGTALGTGAVSNGVATLTTTSLAAGTDSLQAKYPGDTNFTASVSNVVPVVVAGATMATTLTLTSSLNPAYVLSPVTFTVHLGLSGAGVPPAGIAISLSLNSQAIALTTDANGNATYTTSSLSVGSDPVTASFGGTASLQASSAALTEVILPSSFTLALSPTSVMLRSGQTATAAIQLASIGNFAGPVALTVGALPMYATATISPASVTLAAAGTGASTLTLNTLQKKAENVAPTKPASHSGRWTAAMAAALLLWLPFGRKRRTRLRVVVSLLWVGLLMQGLSGCTNAYYTDLVVAPGSYPVTVTGTGQNGSQQTATLTVVITP
jgi:hypothetical protein